MSNILPQAGDLNQKVWNNFEQYCRDQLRGGENELYIISGGQGSLKRIGEGKVNVPAFCWKIVVILPSGEDDLARISEQTRVVSVWMPNEDGPTLAQGQWTDFLVSVDAIEAQTGYDFLSNVPKAVQDALEVKADSGRAKASAGADDAGADAPTQATNADKEEQE